MGCLSWTYVRKKISDKIDHDFKFGSIEKELKLHVNSGYATHLFACHCVKCSFHFIIYQTKKNSHILPNSKMDYIFYLNYCLLKNMIVKDYTVIDYICK